jgi:beta-1,4-N-acetylglucosaminyltransferase
VILVTVGTHTDGFARLVKEMDRIAFQLEEEVVMQIGVTPYHPQAARWFEYATQREMEDLTHRARVIVSHAGSGSILTALAYRKPLIVMPRRKQYGEHLDDHQLEIAGVLAEAKMLLVAYETEDLCARLDEAATFVPAASSRGRLLEAVAEATVGGRRGWLGQTPDLQSAPPMFSPAHAGTRSMWQRLSRRD